MPVAPPLPLPSADQLHQIAQALAIDGLSITPDLLPPEEVHALRQLAVERDRSGAFLPARVGTGPDKRLIPEIRSDAVAWLDAQDPAPPLQRWLHTLDRLRDAINQATFLGLFRWEGHLAVYPPGAAYRKHLDVFRHARERKVSTILYLNPDWAEDHGGQLRLYLDDPTRTLDVPPRAGTLVTFLSEHLHHEVLTSHAHRYSITGWFRLRDL
jgi:SM-20-related protein